MTANVLPSSATTVRPAAAGARHRGNTALLGMTMFMASWAMLFAGLFFAYGLLRQRTPGAWPPADLPRLPLALPGLATVVLASTSVLVETALRRVRAGRAAGISLALGVATLLAIIFVGLQGVVWQDLVTAGLDPTAGSYASVFFTLTVFHALHVVVGVVALGVLTRAATRGRFTPTEHVPLRLWTLYVHMVGVVWGLIYLGVYCL